MKNASEYILRLRNFAQYFGATLFVAIMQLAINPMLAKNLSPEDYAIIGYFSSFNLLLTPFITFYLTNFFIQRFYMVKEEEREIMKRTVVQMLVFFSFALSVISLLCLYVYHVIINNSSEIPFSPYAFLTVFAIPLTGIYSLKLAEFRLQRKATPFAIYTISVGLLSAFFAILFVVLLKKGASGRLLATFLANLLVFIFVFFSERKNLKYPIDRHYLKEIMSFCWPLVIAGMLAFFSTGYDRVLLERLGNVSELGYYSVGVQIVGYLSVFSNAINATFQPDIYESLSKKNYKRLALVIAVIVGSIAVVAFVYIALAPMVISILTAGRYVLSAGYSRVLALSSITAAIYFSSCQVTIAMGYTKMLLFVKIVGSILIIGAFHVLISSSGFYGGAWGTVTSYAIFCIINLLFLFIKRKSHIKHS